MAGFIGGGASVKNNTTGTAAPTINDDITQGYSKTSVWIDGVASPAEIYVCVDNAEGGALWVKTTLTIDELGSMALQAAGSVAITGGTINGASIGATTPSTVTGTTLATGVAAATSRLDVSGTSVTAAGSDADIDINLTPKGTGTVSAGKFTNTAARYMAVLSVATAAGTTVATATDHVVEFTGSTTQTYTLPARVANRELRICNNSTGAVTINRAGSDTIGIGGTSIVLASGDSVILVASSTTWMVF